ncbi:MAG: hypothetical protein HC788_10560 [Sphingopyxis sp.]|nr:hypothetical protein [Sphingopyxis sp.]
MTQEANSDELSAFVSSTLKAIAVGIADAQDTQVRSAHGTGVSGFAAPENVEFDIAVTARSTGTAGGGLKVAVFGIGVNATGESPSENSSINRIESTVPTRFKSTDASNVAAPTLRMKK